MKGRTFGRLKVVARCGYYGRTTTWACECSCGNGIIIRRNRLIDGSTRSCGCLASEESRKRLTKHGEYRSTENAIWNSMIQRCTNPKNQDWPNYGGRGVTVCSRWLTFENFLSDMGRRPSKDHSLDRKESSGNYEPDNCRWATSIEQNRNRRDNIRTSDGRLGIDVAAEHGVSAAAFYQRVRAGKSPDAAAGVLHAS
jgi:hypothetical protein